MTEGTGDEALWRTKQYTGAAGNVSNASLQPILALISHSAAGNPSQYMFEKAFARHELDWRYLSLEIEPDSLGDAVRGIKALGFQGGNCTYPHQRAVCEHLDSLGRVAELTGVVNCVVRREDQLVGENTEGQAFLEVFRRSVDPADKRIVLLGAAEMARSIGVELALAGAAEIVVVDHDEPAASELVELITGNSETPASFEAWEETYELPAETDVLINAVSTEIDDPDAPLALELGERAEGLCVADITVDPPDTWLIQEARQRGAKSVDGLEMYIQQAVINLKLWTAVDADPSRSSRGGGRIFGTLKPQPVGANRSKRVLVPAHIGLGLPQHLPDWLGIGQVVDYRVGLCLAECRGGYPTAGHGHRSAAVGLGATHVVRRVADNDYVARRERMSQQLGRLGHCPADQIGPGPPIASKGVGHEPVGGDTHAEQLDPGRLREVAADPAPLELHPTGAASARGRALPAALRTYTLRPAGSRNIV